MQHSYFIQTFGIWKLARLAAFLLYSTIVIWKLARLANTSCALLATAPQAAPTVPDI
jgi:hypothetical protein